MPNHAPPLSAERLNPLIEELSTWAKDTYDRLLEAFYATGNPPGTVPLTPAEQYRNLVTLRDTGSPIYWENPDAKAALIRLAGTFGPPPPFEPPRVQPFTMPQVGPAPAQPSLSLGAPQAPQSLTMGG